MPFTVDDTKWPILVCSLAGDIPMADVDAFLAALAAVHQKKGPFISLTQIDGLEMKTSTIVRRRRMAEGVDELSQKGAFIAEGVIVSSQLLRGLFTAYSWLRSVNRHPLKSFQTLDAGKLWAQEILKKSGG